MITDKYNNGTPMYETFTHIPEISVYCHNYYIGIDRDLLYGKSDDDDETEWWILHGENNPVLLGYSYCSEGNLLEKTSRLHT